MERETRVMEIILVPPGEPAFHEMATRISIHDEAGGEFVRIRQQTEKAKPGEIEIDPKEWPVLREAIDRMIADCREFE